MYRQMSGLLLTVLSCTALGCYMSRELKLRLFGLRNIDRVFEFLKGEIRYGNAALPEAFEHAALQCDEVMGEYLFVCAEELKKKDGRTLKTILEEKAVLLKQKNGLKENDIVRFVQVLGRMGYLDAAMQLRLIERGLDELEKECRTAAKEYQEKGNVYRCLGFMGGLFLAVIFL